MFFSNFELIVYPCTLLVKDRQLLEASDSETAHEGSLVSNEINLELK